MNLLHMKYAVEVARAGSINKASEALLIAQPHLSRSIKELEADLGITIFDRSSRGMVLTSEGEEFVRYAQKVLAQIDEIEQLFRSRRPVSQHFSISVPRADSAARAFARFTRRLGNTPAKILYEETDTSSCILNVFSGASKLGIIRYAAADAGHYRRILEEKKLAGTHLTSFRPLLAVGAGCPLAEKALIDPAELLPYTEIAYAEACVPSVPLPARRKASSAAEGGRRVLLAGREGQLEVLAENPGAYMWTSPLSPETLARYHLVARECAFRSEEYHDELIHARDYALTGLDRLFLEELARETGAVFPLPSQ